MRDPAVDLWALDEVHFAIRHEAALLTRVPPETKDPVVYHHPTRRSVGYFGAVRLRDGRLFHRRETGRFNAQSFWEFLTALQTTSRSKGRRVVVISDNAQS